MAVQMFNPFLRLVRRHGPELEAEVMRRGLQLLSQDGIAVAELADMRARVPHATAIELMALVAEVLDDPAVGLHAGVDVQGDDLGLYEYLARSAATLNQALWARCRYIGLLHDGCEAQMMYENGAATWRHRMVHGAAEPVGANEYAIATFAARVAADLGGSLGLREVHFRHGEPQHAAELRRVLGAELRFGCEWNALVLPNEVLERPLSRSDPGLHAVLRGAADDALGALPRRTRLARQVKTLIGKRLDGSEYGLPWIADALHMSPRSLRRKLQSEGTSHSELLDEARKELALAYLANPELDVSEIGFRLAFAHPPAFHRAFRRWFGMRPGEYRRRHAGTPMYRFFRGG